MSVKFSNYFSQAFSNALAGAKDEGGASATEDPKPPPNTFLDRYGFITPITPTEKGPKPVPKSEEETDQRHEHLGAFQSVLCAGFRSAVRAFDAELNGHAAAISQAP